MKSSAKKVELAPYDDLFSTEESRQDAKLEKIQEIPLSELHPFKGHPFKVKDDEAMMETADSVRQYGVLVPAIARPDPEGGYELVAGHRRHRASELAEKETMPVIVRDLDDDAATIIMVDSNLQRESLLPSERAFAYRMKLEAIKHQGERSDLTSRQVGEKSQTSIQLVASQAGESQRQVQRYIRLTELIPELLDMVDEKKIALNPAYELSFLKKEEQQDLLDAMDSEQATPSLSQAQRLKKYSQEGHLTLDMMRVIMGEEKKSDLDRVRMPSGKTASPNMTWNPPTLTGFCRPSRFLRKGIRELRKSKTLHRFLDFDMYRGTGLGAFRLSGSSIQEQYILKQERREEYERKRRKEQAFEEEADAMTRRVAARVASMSPEEKRAMLEKAGITIIT